MVSGSKKCIGGCDAFMKETMTTTKLLGLIMGLAGLAFSLVHFGDDDPYGSVTPLSLLCRIGPDRLRAWYGGIAASRDESR